ncbi:MAG: 50S ribosomal protein L1, partial [Asgard group archaeon]
DVEALLDQYKRTVRLRLRDTPVLNARVGTVDMDPEKIAENIMTVMETLERKLEHGMNNIKALTVKTTMGPQTKIDLKT